MRTFRSVDTDGSVLEGLEEVQVVVHRIIMATGDFCSHEAGKHFLGPYIFKPLQRDKVAKPEVGRLVGDDLHTCQLILLGGMLLKEHTTFAQLDGSRMLHAAKLVVGQDHQSELLERTGDAGVTFHPFDRLSDLVEYLVELCHLSGVGLAIECTDGLTLTTASLLVEVASHEGIKIGGQLTDIVAGHRLPSVGHVERSHEDRSEVGLVEAGEHRTGQVGHEEDVHIFLVAVQGLVKTRKTDLYLVLSFLQHLHRNDDMLILIGSLHGTALLLLAGEDITGAVVVALEIEHQILPHLQVEPDDGFSCYPLIRIGRNVKCQVIDDITDVCFSVVGELFGDAFGKHLGMCV